MECPKMRFKGIYFVQAKRAFPELADDIQDIKRPTSCFHV